MQRVPELGVLSHPIAVAADRDDVTVVDQSIDERCGEAIPRPLARGAVHAHIGDVVEPLPSLLIEVDVIDERPAVDEIVAQIADGALDFPLGLRAVWSTCAWREAPVVRERRNSRLCTSGPRCSRKSRVVTAFI